MQDKGIKLISSFFFIFPIFRIVQNQYILFLYLGKKSVIKKSDFKLELETKMNTV